MTTGFDTKKFKKYYQYAISQVYSEGHSPMHKNLTKQVVDQIVYPLNIPFNAKILDVGCGPGYFLDDMKRIGYINMTGVTWSDDDIKLCVENGHTVVKGDISFLSDRNSTVDFVFSRHSLEHSPFPYITLLEYNRVLKTGGLLYVEVPASDCPRKHEYNANHYSIMGATMWHALFLRSGFKLRDSRNLTVKLNDSRTGESFNETYHVFVLVKEKQVP